jgi:hypothetical protein
VNTLTQINTTDRIQQQEEGSAIHWVLGLETSQRGSNNNHAYVANINCKPRIMNLAKQNFDMTSTKLNIHGISSQK